MQKIGEIINIANKVFVKNIKKQIKKIKNSQFRDEVKNNLSMAGELLIDSIYMFNKKKTIAAISILRNVYEMTLKGIVLDKNEEIFNSYKIIKKSGNADKDNSSKIRKFIGENFKEYFYVLENDESFNNIYGNGVLTYLYDKLCSYSHASKIMEELYKIKNDEVIVEQMICIFLLYAMVIFYMDATSVKLNRTNISEATCIFYTIIVAYSFYDWTINKDELNKLQKYNEIIDLSEIKNLIVSNNSRMRTPQTISAIARILENIDYKLIKKEDITRLKISIKSTYLNKLISYIDNDSNIIDVATKNKSVYNNLRIDLPKEIENEKTKAITK